MLQGYSRITYLLPLTARTPHCAAPAGIAVDFGAFAAHDMAVPAFACAAEDARFALVLRRHPMFDESLHHHDARYEVE